MEKTKAGRETKSHKKGDKQKEKKLWKLYMGGVPVSLTEDQLGDILCEKIDNFKVHIMKNAEQGNSKGCGFIEVYTKEDFDYLIKNKILVDGKELQIEQYIDNEEERKKKMFENNERSIHVGGLPLEVDAEDLNKYFSQFGEVKRAYIIYNLGEEKKSRGFGFVEFVSKKVAKKVLLMEHTIMDKVITVTPRHSKKEIKSTKGKDSTSKNQSVSGSSISSKNKPIGGAASGKASSKNSNHQAKPFEYYPSSYKPTASERGLHERFNPYMREVDGHYYLVHPNSVNGQQLAYGNRTAGSPNPNDQEAFEPFDPQGQKQAKFGAPDRWEPRTSNSAYPHYPPVYGNHHHEQAAGHHRPPHTEHQAYQMAFADGSGPMHAAHYYQQNFADMSYQPGYYPSHPMDYNKKHTPYMEGNLHPPSSSLSQKSYGQHIQVHPGYENPYSVDLQTTKSQPNKPTSKPEGFVYDARNGIAPVKPKKEAIKHQPPNHFLTPNIKQNESRPVKAFDRFSLNELTPDPKKANNGPFQAGFTLEIDDRLN
jgi:RNA recognition motif-containing protein